MSTKICTVCGKKFTAPAHHWRGEVLCPEDYETITKIREILQDEQDEQEAIDRIKDRLRKRLQGD